MKTKNLLIGGALVFGGYLIGFYEMKYKTVKILLEAKIKEESK